jgi:hypothetical protein
LTLFLSLVSPLFGLALLLASRGSCPPHRARHSPLRASPRPVPPQAAQKRYDEATGGRPERLVSGSDDFTMFLWQPSTSKAHLARMTGHVQLINQASGRAGGGGRAGGAARV